MARGLNLAIRVDGAGLTGGYMVSVARPEIFFRGSQMELSFTDDVAATVIAGSPHEQKHSIVEIADRVIKHVEQTIDLFERPLGEHRRVIGFHPVE